MVLTNDDDLIPLMIDYSICVPHVNRRRQGLWARSGVLPVETLVRIVGEVDSSLVDEI